MNTYTVEELSGNHSFELNTFDTFDEAQDFMLECIGNNVTETYGNEILDNDKEYMTAMEDMASYYTITNKG